MKTQIKNYTFNSSTKQISFTDYTTIRLDSILLITNVTDNIIIYNFANQSLGGTVLGNVLTLTYNTISMDSGDSLQIFYEGENTLATDQSILDLKEVTNTLATNESILDLNALTTSLLSISDNMNNSVELLKILRKLLDASSTQDSAQRQRITIDAITAGLTLAAVTTVGTVSSVTNMQSIGGVDYRWQMVDQARLTYSNSIRNNITF